MKELQIIFLLTIGMLFTSFASADEGPCHIAGHHRMQHGFILAGNNTFASHLVASGHHSRQVSIGGMLNIEIAEERDRLLQLQSANLSSYYFVFQAQDLDLACTEAGMLLRGHIIMSAIGDYEPANIVVTKASFLVDRVFLNVLNPFFGSPRN